MWTIIIDAFAVVGGVVATVGGVVSGILLFMVLKP
jgi:hypothetical protein